MPEITRTVCIVLLFVGMGLLIFTFLSAFVFLLMTPTFGELTGALEDIFGEALGPLVEACIKVMYLGVMGWVGSVMLRRGTQALATFRVAERRVAPYIRPPPRPPPPPARPAPQPAPAWQPPAERQEAQISAEEWERIRERKPWLSSPVEAA